MFTTQNARTFGAQGNAAKRERRTRNVSPETALQTAVAVLYDATVGKNTSPLRVQAARAILATLHDVGIKPSQRDIAVVFRGARHDTTDQRNDSANDTRDEATPPAKE